MTTPIGSTPRYDLAIIGGGSAGLTAAAAARQLGARAALIEGKRLGGECTWTGCIPSKTLIAAARAAHEARQAARFGVQVTGVQVDFAAVMRHVHATVEEVYAEETPDVLRQTGVEVIEQYARFTGAHTLALADGTAIWARHVLIATGASPVIPPGFADAPYLTNETLFSLDRLPEHLIIVGGGPVGTEMAQAFRRLGAEVTLIGGAARLLPREDDESSAFIAEVFAREGIRVLLGVKATGAHRDGDAIAVSLADGSTVRGSAVLLALGKQPHLGSLNLAAAGVAVRDGRLVLNDRLRTSQPHIWAAGDVAGGPQFTHYAGWQAFQAVRNALFPLTSVGTRAHVPAATFTDPEIAHVGLTESQARAQHGADAQVTRLPLSRADRAMTEGKPEGFIKVIHLPNGKLIGAHIVGVNAGEMLNEWVSIFDKGGRVWDAAFPMRVYPTLGTGNVILATEQVKMQLASGFLGHLLRGVSRLSR